MARSLPEIPARGLAALGFELPALAEIRIALTGGRGNAKFHVPLPDPGLRRFHHEACRYSKPADQASTYGLLEVFDRICKKCPIVLPGAADALWRAVAFAAGRREILDRAQAYREPRTWLRYARNAARHDLGDDEQVEQWLRQARTDAALAADSLHRPPPRHPVHRAGGRTRSDHPGDPRGPAGPLRRAAGRPGQHRR
ncbi:hypothetical protein ABTY00_27040 [Streptomyces microflavus]|uniref:hypothetical protein n=1 Tax=Streptomyces microflavus TaxID=1919 RepID=UPI0033254498